MNALTPIDLNDAETWNSAFSKVNCWRGECVQAFAEVEAAVSQTLLALHARQPDIDLPLLVGLRFRSMEQALATSGVEASRLSTVQKALAIFSPHHDLRTFLCHSTSRVTLDRRGQWSARLKMLCFEHGKEVRAERMVDEEEARDLLLSLKTAAASLKGALGQVRAALR